MATDGKKIKVTLVKGTNACRAEHRAKLRVLGLRLIRHTFDFEETKSVRGMINKVSYLVSVAE